MAARIPLVINNGLIQQLQSGDTILAPASTASIRSLTNGEASAAIVIGTPVYMSGADSMKRAQANATSTSKVIGLGYDTTTASAAAGNVCVNGTLVATTVQWDAVAGTTGGLTFNSTYYLDPATVGKITGTAPTTVGQTVVAIGTALSSTELEIAIQPYILL
jgi:hypothetical protein